MSYDQITQNIFVGDVYTAIQGCAQDEDYIKKLNIKVVISALSEDEYEDYMISHKDFPGIDWYRFVLDDYQNENILGSFFTVYRIIKKAIEERKQVLIHCAAGISRSATLAIAYLMIDNNWSAKQAIDFVAKRRPQINPNFGFRRQLLTLEYKLKSYNQIFPGEEKLKTALE